MARPVELAKSSRFILLSSLCIVIAGLYLAREVLIPIALAVLLSFLLTPPVAWLEKFKIPRMLATVMVVLIGVGLIAGIGYGVGSQLKSVANDLPKYQSQLKAKLHWFREHGGFITRAEKGVEAITSGPATNPTSAGATPPAWPPTSENPLPVRQYPAPSTPIGVLRDYASSAMAPLATGALVLVFVIFMILDREDLRDRLIRLLGHGRLNVTTQALDEASTRISSYLAALAIVNGSYALCTTLGLWLIGKFLGHGQSFPNVFVWGIFVGLCRFIPYIGIWIGGGVPLMLAFALFPGNSVFIAVMAMFVGLELIISQFIEPKWYGASTGMSPLAVLISAVFWAWLWGTIGLLLATPMTVILVVIGKYVPQLKFLDILLREEPVLTLPVRFYQRLIALDQDEAADLAEDYLKEKRSLELAYDDLLIPALSLAETDRHHDRLEEGQLKFVRQSVRDISENLAEQYRVMLGDQPAPPAGTPIPPRETTRLSAAASGVASAAAAVANVASNVANAVTGRSNGNGDSTPKDPSAEIEHHPTGVDVCPINVLCLPARDDADEIVARMLAQLLEARGYCALTPTASALASEMVDMIAIKKVDVVCISAMPPATVAHARYLCKLIETRYPEIRMMVGLWTLKGDPNKARARVSRSGTFRVLTTLHDAQQEIEQLAQPTVLKRSSEQRAATAAEALSPEPVVGIA